MATVLSTIEGKVELTDSTLVFHGLNRWQPTVSVPLANVSAVFVDPGNFGTPATLTVTTNSGDRISRRKGPRGRQEVPAFAALVSARP